MVSAHSLRKVHLQVPQVLQVSQGDVGGGYLRSPLASGWSVPGARIIYLRATTPALMLQTPSVKGTWPHSTCVCAFQNLSIITFEPCCKLCVLHAPNCTPKSALPSLRVRRVSTVQLLITHVA